MPTGGPAGPASNGNPAAGKSIHFGHAAARSQVFGLRRNIETDHLGDCGCAPPDQRRPAGSGGLAVGGSDGAGAGLGGVRRTGSLHGAVANVQR